MFNDAAITLERRGFLASALLAGAWSTLPGLSYGESDPVAVRLFVEQGDCGPRFRVFLDNATNAPWPARTVQVFALGEREPMQASFDLTKNGSVDDMTGHLQLSQDQNVMALVRFANGAMIHDRSSVSVTRGRRT